MVDCRPAAGAAPHDLAHSAPNGGPPPQENNHHQQINQGGAGAGPGAGGDMAPAHGVPSPAARASTPAAVSSLAQYGPGGHMGAMNMGGGMSPAMGYAPYYGGGKALGGVVWVPPPLPPPLPPPPHHVNPHVLKSVQQNGSDLPMNDIPTLRYYFNLGVECMWAAYGPPPPRPYAPRDIAQDMQQMSLNERACAPPERHKPAHGAPDKPPLPGKGNGQRSLLGPRFHKRGNQDGGNQNQNHNQNKGHNNNNNNMANKGPNNRRNSHESRPPVGPGGPVGPGAPCGEAPDCVLDPGCVPVPYMAYPPPMFPVQYYSIDSNEPGMMGMMGGMGYVNYEEGGEYVAPYYPPVYPPHLPPAPAPHPLHHPDHK